MDYSTKLCRPHFIAKRKFFGIALEWTIHVVYLLTPTSQYSINTKPHLPYPPPIVDYVTEEEYDNPGAVAIGRAARVEVALDYRVHYERTGGG